MDPVTTDQIGEGSSKTYGSDIAPSGGQDMWAFDPIAGTFPPQERGAAPGVFTGGDGEVGLGGMAEGMSPGGVTPTGAVPGSVYERRGF